MQPIIHEQLTMILMRHFDAQPRQAAQLATKLLETLKAYDLEVIKGDWTKLEPKEQEGTTWESLARRADELVQERNGIKPWNPPELQ